MSVEYKVGRNRANVALVEGNQDSRAPQGTLLPELPLLLTEPYYSGSLGTQKTACEVTIPRLESGITEQGGSGRITCNGTGHVGESVLMRPVTYVFVYTYTYTHKKKKENKNRYYSLIKITTEHCGLEVGYPPSSTPTLMCHLRALRQDSRRETGGSAHRWLLSSSGLPCSLFLAFTPSSPSWSGRGRGAGSRRRYKVGQKKKRDPEEGKVRVGSQESKQEQEASICHPRIWQG